MVVHVVAVVEEYSRKMQVVAFGSKAKAKAYAKEIEARSTGINIEEPWNERSYTALVFEDKIVQK